MKETKCSHFACPIIVDEFGKNGKCIFHCNKDDWFTYQNEKKIWDETKVEEFWRRIRKFKISKNDLDFFYYIFPKFEKYPQITDLITNKLIAGVEKKEDNYKLKLKEKDDGKNFWSKDSILSFEKKVHFNGSTFEDTTIFDFINFKESVNFIGCTFNNDVSFKKTTFNNSVQFPGVSFENRVFFVDNILNNTELEFWSSYFKARLLISNLYSKNSKINFNYTHFFENSIVFLSNIKIDRFNINNLYNFSKNFRIADLIVISDLRIINTSLNNIEFTDNDFSKIPKITFTSVSFDNVRFNNIDWGKINLNRFNANRDIFRQIKHQYDLQGNRIDANTFYSIEMKSYRLELLNKIKEKSGRNLLKKIWFTITNLDFWIFTFSNLSSNFSKNFILPILWLLLLSLTFYLFSFHKMDFSNLKSFKILQNHLIMTDWRDIAKNIMEYLNPFDTKVKGPILLWIIYKSSSAYLIYQFIISLRRQTKR